MMPCSLIELLDVHISDQGEGLLKSTVVNWLTQEQGGAAQATDMDDCSSTFLNKPIHVILEVNRSEHILSSTGDLLMYRFFKVLGSFGDENCEIHMEGVLYGEAWS